MIFLRYESFSQYLRQYPVTAAIIALNLIIFAIDTFSGNVLLDNGYFRSHSDFDPFGMTEPWRYVTAIFLHLGFEHLFFNMVAMLIFAPPLERMLGHVRYAVFYLLCGIAGSFLSAVVEPVTAAAGASGSIYGLYGAYLYLATMKKTLDQASRKTVYMILIIGILFSIFTQGVSLWGHVGGLIGGFLFAYGYDWYLMRRKR